MKIKKLPDVPGIYYFKQGRKILYIGKATSLKSRVRSYFASDLGEKRSPWIEQMIGQADRIDFKQTDSVLEALILESQEIKKHQPPYNTREKDDKSYLYVGITEEDFPRILPIRGSELKVKADSWKLKAIYGPFPYGSELREALKIIRKIFPFRDKCKPGSGKPCFNAQIGLCPGVCDGRISKTDYQKTIRHLKLFFEGKKSQLIKTLEREMKARAKKMEFEKAGELKQQIFALQHIQDVALIKRDTEASPRTPLRQGLCDAFRIEAYDIAHISGKHTVGAMVVMQDGELSKKDYRKFKLKGELAEKPDDVGNLLEIVKRRFKHPEWPFPNLIVVDGSKAQINIVNHVLKNSGLMIPVVGVVKDEKHKAREVLNSRGLSFRESKESPRRGDIIRLNQEAHRFAIAYHRKLRGKIV